ncbi:MAG: aldo/keto reductase [Clostridia bacterium]
MIYQANEKRYEDMKYSYTGKSGLKLPIVSLGLWQNFGSVDPVDNMREMLRTAFDYGITHFDLANNYGPIPGSAEENFGAIFKKDFKTHRDELILSTKAGYTMWDGPYGDFGSRKYLTASLDQSLTRMGVDYVDIFYHHRMDPNTPLEETMGALASIVNQGKALYVGISNYDGETMTKAAEILKDLRCPFIINQNRYSILDRRIENNGLKKASEEHGLGIMAFSPLEQGMLTDKYLKGIPADSRATRELFLKTAKITPEAIAQISALNDIATDRGQTLAQMALQWVLKDDVVTSVLIGASKPAQIIENAKIVNAPKFTSEELAKIDKIVL